MWNSWASVKFGDVLIGGPRNGIYKKKEFHGSGAHIVNMGELFAHPRLRLIPMKRIEVTPQELARFSLQPGDLLFARRSLVAEGAGKCAIVLQIDEPTVFESSIIRCRPDPGKADSLYLFYFFNSPQGRHLLGTIRRQVAVAGITGKDLVQIEIPLPPLPEQRAIAHILGTLDDKIELLRRMSETLEEMARAIFKAWFVDFLPVRAKMEGRWTRGQSLPGLPAEGFGTLPSFYDLFPDRLVPSELGEIPEGWEVQRFADIVAQVRESVYPSETPELIFKHFSIPAFDSGQWPYAEVGADIKSQKWVVPPGAVLLSKLNPEVERVWLVDVQPDENAVCSTEFMVLQPQCPYGRAYVYSLIRSPAFRETLKGLVTGTSKSHQRVRATDILNILVLKPQKALVSAFEQISDPLLERAQQDRRESRTLAALRDALLPKLIRGEIRVKDAERFLEEGI